MRNVLVMAMALIVVILAGIALATFFALQMAREFHVQESQLVDTEGRVVATSEKQGTITGVRFAHNERRLTSNISVGGDDFSLDNLEMHNDEFDRIRASYTQGLTDWVVKLPDDTVRAVRILSVDGGNAYGTTSSWWGSVMWQARCPEQAEGDICQITWRWATDFSETSYELMQIDPPDTSTQSPLEDFQNDTTTSVSSTGSSTTSGTAQPTRSPTAGPTSATASPTVGPTVSPTVLPTELPTILPTVGPSTSPTATPTAFPTALPTASPTMSPSTSPTSFPALSQTLGPMVGLDTSLTNSSSIVVGHSFAPSLASNGSVTTTTTTTTPMSGMARLLAARADASANAKFPNQGVERVLANKDRM